MNVKAPTLFDDGSTKLNDASPNVLVIALKLVNVGVCVISVMLIGFIALLLVLAPDAD